MKSSNNPSHHKWPRDEEKWFLGEKKRAVHAVEWDAASGNATYGSHLNMGCLGDGFRGSGCPLACPLSGWSVFRLPSKLGGPGTSTKGGGPGGSQPGGMGHTCLDAILVDGGVMEDASEATQSVRTEPCRHVSLGSKMGASVLWNGDIGAAASPEIQGDCARHPPL